jgi:hypothetical protein
MARYDVALGQARGAYERAHVLSAARGIVLAIALTVLAIALHRTTRATWFVAATLAATLGALAWRGGAWKRGALAGVVAGVPVFIAPVIYYAFTRGHCRDCQMTPSLVCMTTCIATSVAAGLLVGRIATRDDSPRRFGLGAIASALATGLLGCGTVGFAGALGVAAGLVAGGVTGWVVAGRTAQA